VKCLQCGFTTTEKDTRMCVRHALKHVNLERFYCPLCQFGAATHVEIIRHSETKHRLSFLIAADRVEHMIGNEKFCAYMVKCYGDEMGARIVKNYAQHQEWGFRAKICQVCHQPLQGLRELHIARYHFPFAKPYSCPVDNCEYDSRSESIFKDHFDKTHSDCSNLKPVFISERCPEAFQKMYDKCFPSEYRVLSPDERAQLIAENESYDAFLRETETQRHQDVTAAVSQFMPDESDSIDDDRLMGTPITIALPTAPDIGIIPGEQMGPMLFAPPINVGRRPLEMLKKKRKEKKHRHHKKRKRRRRSREGEGEESEDEADDESIIPNAVADPAAAAAALMGLDEREAKARRKAHAEEQMTAADVEPRVLVEKV